MNNQNQNRNQNSNQNKNEKENRSENQSQNNDGKRAPGIPGARKFFILPQIFPAGRNRGILP